MKMQNTVKELVLTSSQFPKGIRACIVFSDSGQHYCGYIEVPESLEGLDSMDLSVHGEVTYDEIKTGRRVIGFDCTHSCDYTLAKAEWEGKFASHHMFQFNPLFISKPMSALNFRTQTYVINELRKLVAQFDEFQIRKSCS